MAKATKKSKKQKEINVNWKKVGIVSSIVLNIVFIGAALSMFVWYKASPGSFALNLWIQSNETVCNDLGQDAMKEIRKNVTSNTNVNDKEYAPQAFMVCGLDYQTGNSVEFSEKLQKSIYREILKARGE